MGALMDLVEALHPLHRTLASEGTDRALALIGERLPAAARYEIETYRGGEPAWTWRVPERYVVHEARLETEDGRVVADFATSPLHLVSYSEPVDAVLDWSALEPHLHTAPHRPAAIPWEYRYYERSWGFCVSQEVHDALPRDGRYRALIRSELRPDPGLSVGVGVIEPEGGAREDGGEMLVCAHVCHPAQANDDAAGVASLVGLAHRLAARPLPPGALGVRFLFCPETIGSIAYLSRHEELIGRLRGGIFSEMTGNDNTFLLQRTRQDDHRLDRVARHVLQARGPFREGRFREHIANDELVINGPGVDCPCVSLSRWPYPEYHTSDDVPAILAEERLDEAAAVMEEIVRVYATDRVPTRTFRGPVFLSGYGLWVDWREQPALSAALDAIMNRLEGDRTIVDIALELELDPEVVHSFVARLHEHGLVTLA